MHFRPPLLLPGESHITNPALLHALLVGAKDLLHADPRSLEVRSVFGGRLMMVCHKKPAGCVMYRASLVLVCLMWVFNTTVCVMCVSATA